jgi:predicted Zn-dependent protease
VAAGYVASYSREQELQADQLGAEYLVRSHYDPRNMVDVIAVLKAQERFAADQARAQGRVPRQGGDWLASHPSNEKRLQEITQIAASYAGQSTYADEGRARYLKAVDGLPFGDSRESGVIRGRNFYHEPLGFVLTAPADWRIQNEQDAITIVNKAGDAALIFQPVPAKAGSTHEEIIRNAFKPTQGKVERRDINGLSATHFVGQRQGAQGRTQNIVATVVTGPQGRNYVMLYAAKDSAARQRAAAKLEEAEGSFRPLTNADRAAARPWVLRSVAYPRGGFAELAKRSPLNGDAQAQLRLINGVYGTADTNLPRVGQPVKVVE